MIMFIYGLSSSFKMFLEYVVGKNYHIFHCWVFLYVEDQMFTQVPLFREIFYSLKHF